MLSENEDNNLISKLKLANYETFYQLYKSYSKNYLIHNIFLFIELCQILSLTISHVVRYKLNILEYRYLGRIIFF
jgi:hypothetical protein